MSGAVNKNVETAWASAMFLEIRDGKTISRRNCDYFEPF